MPIEKVVSIKGLGKLIISVSCWVNWGEDYHSQVEHKEEYPRLAPNTTSVI